MSARGDDASTALVSRQVALVLVPVLFLAIYIFRDRGGIRYAPGLQGVLDDVLVAVAVVLAMRTTQVSRKAIGFHTWTALGTVAVAVAAALTESVWLFRATNTLSAYLIGAAAYVVFRHVLRARRVSSEVFMGSLAVYLAVGVLFGVLFTTIAVENPSSFDPPEFARYGGETALYYYSFVALTTLGFGDITPVSSLTRVLTTVETMLGLVVFAALIGRVVGLSTVQVAETQEFERLEEVDRRLDVLERGSEEETQT